MDRMQDEAASLKKAYKAVKDEQKSFMLYSFNKMAEASTALEQMAALVNRCPTSAASSRFPLSSVGFVH